MVDLDIIANQVWEARGPHLKKRKLGLWYNPELNDLILMEKDRMTCRMITHLMMLSFESWRYWDEYEWVGNQ